MKSSEKLKLKRKVPENKSNSRFSKGHFWGNTMCQNSIACQSKLSFWVSKIKIGPLLSYFIFKYFILLKISQINYNLLTPISHPFHLTSFFETGQFEDKTYSVHCRTRLFELKTAKQSWAKQYWAGLIGLSRAEQKLSNA